MHVAHALSTGFDPDSEGTVRAIEENLWGYNDAYLLLPGAMGYAGRDVRWVRTGGVPANRVYAARLSEAHLEPRIAELLGRFRLCGESFTWQVGPTCRPHDLGERLLENGFHEKSPMIGMARELDEAVPEPPMPDGFGVREVVSREDVDRWSGVFGEVFGKKPGDARAYAAVFSHLLLEIEVPWHLYEGCLDGKPVATCGVFGDGGVVGLYWVGTAPAARRRGVGSALTWVALERARARGARLATLQSSAMGRGVYQGLGFTEHCTIGVYEWNP